MNSKRICAEAGLGRKLAAEMKDLFPGKGPKEIASRLGIEIIYEKPVVSRQLVRLSEYRKKQKQIAVFFREVEHTAIAHELVHHLESARGIRLDRDASEKEAKAFAEVLA